MSDHRGMALSAGLVASTSDAAQTARLASGLAELMRAGDVVVLVGDLGSGKTVFTQGLGAGLGVDATITSPTFALVQSYQGRLGLHHLDVYRLNRLNEALDLGLGELLDDDAVVVIEWGDTIAPVLPQDYIEVRIFADGASTERRIEFLFSGNRWQARVRAVSAVVANVCGDPDDGTEPDDSTGPDGTEPAEPVDTPASVEPPGTEGDS